MCPKIVDVQEKKKIIIEATIALYSECNYENIKMKDIANRANIGKGTIYEYFKSREDLLAQSAIHWIKNIAHDFQDTLVATGEPLKILKKSILNLAKAFLREEHHNRALYHFMYLLLYNEQLSPYINTIMLSYVSVIQNLQNILEKGAEKGIFTPETKKNAEKISLNILAYLDGISINYFLSNKYYDVYKQIDVFIEQLLLAICVRK